VLERRLDPPLPLPVYASAADALGGNGAPAGEAFLNAGERAALFVGPLPDDKLPKDATPGVRARFFVFVF
jgi:tripeptidyl-peptidase-2